MYTIGLTGGIGSGKSRVSELLAGYGVPIIDTDVVAHALTAPGGQAMQAVRERFGARAVRADGALDRDWMRSQVFSDPGAKQALEQILHPMIGQAVTAALHAVRSDYSVLVVPLLVESGRWLSRVDRVCVVDCEPDTQLQRVQQRSGMTTDIIRRIMAAQVDRETRLAAAHDVVSNGQDVTLPALERAVRTLHEKWSALAQASHAK